MKNKNKLLNNMVSPVMEYVPGTIKKVEFNLFVY